MTPTNPTSAPVVFESDMQLLSDPAPTPKRLPIEQHAEQLAVPAWLFAAARAHHNWPQGRELTEAEFQAALDKTKGIRIGGPATQEKK